MTQDHPSQTGASRSRLGVILVLSAIVAFVAATGCWMVAIWTVDSHDSIRWAQTGGLLLIPVAVAGVGGVTLLATR